jgi:hypothetical protein
MSTKQSCHIIPTKVSHPYLCGTGMDKTLAYNIGQDFAFKATEDGVIDRFDAKNNLVFLKYKSGIVSAIDLEEKPAFNQGSGFYTTNRLELIKDFVKVGAKFKKGDIIAANASFFKPMQDEGSFGFCPGRLTKIAVMCLDNTYEDSAVVTSKLSNEMSSEIISSREVVLKKNSRIISIAKVGDIVGTNDPLVLFEEVGENEKESLAALDKLSNVDNEAISELARSTARSKYAGKIVSMDIHYNANLEDMHPTLRNVVQTYINTYDRKSKSLSGIQEDELITLPNTKKVDSNKIMGNEMEGVLITFYIKHDEILGIGSKITYFGSCKTIIAETIDPGLEPYSEYRPEQQIDAFLTPISIISRQVQDLFLMGWTNKILLELKEQVLKDLGL